MKNVCLFALLACLSISVYGQAPTISVSANTPDTVCAGTTVTYTAHGTNTGSSPLYVWSVNGVITSGGTTFSYIPVNGDRISCSILSSSPTAVPDTASTNLTMNVRPVFAPQVDISTGMGDTVCTGSTVTFTAVPLGGGTTPTYKWWKNYVPVSTAASFSYTPVNGDIITCAMVSNYVCRTADSANKTSVITVSPPLSPSVNILTSTGGPTSCGGDSVTYMALPTAGGYSPIYQWKVNGAVVGTSAGSYSYLPTSGDVINVKMTSSFPCLMTPTTTATFIQTVLPVEVPIVTVAAHPGSFIPVTPTDTFVCYVVSGAGSAPAYQWYVSGVPVSGATTSVWIAASASLHINDSVACQVTNTDQCSHVSTFEWLRIGNNSVSVDDVTNTHSIEIFPNPNSGSFIVRGKINPCSGEVINVRVTDMLGRTVSKNELIVANGTINMQLSSDNGLPAGQYLLSIHSEHVNEVVHFEIAK